jgi:long-chain fatty acid transport protein
MKIYKKFLISLTLLILVFSVNVYATNGYWSYGYGAQSKSMAGACVAMTLGAMCAASNPASMVHIGNRLDYGLSYFVPTRGFTANNDSSPNAASIPAGTYESSNDWFLIPHLGYNYMLDDNSAIGISIGGNGGMNTEYNSAIFRNFSNPNDPSTLASSPTGIDLKQMFIGVTYSRKINKRHSFGITPIFSIQSFEAQGLQPFKQFSLHPNYVTNNGTDYSYGGGVRVGWLGQVTDSLTLGAAYQSKMWMSKFDDYKGLLAEEGDFDIPSNYDIGFAIKATPAVTLAFDYQRIEFSKVKAVANQSDIVFIPGKTLLGTSDGLGFGWEDMNIFKFGVQWVYSADLTLRFGYSQANQVVPNSQALFNLLAPGVIRKHYTFGFSKAISQTIDFNVAFMYAPNEKVYGKNPNTGPQTGFIEMDQYEIAISWGIKL